jgi:superfamily II DNA or RNA helicase
VSLCKLIIKDEVNIQFEGLSPITRRKLVDAVKYKLPYAHNLPSVRLGRWDGTVSFCDIAGRSYFHLLDRLLPLIVDQYNLEIEDRRQTYDFKFEEVNEDSYSHIKWPSGHRMEGEGIKLREHQVTAINDFLKNTQGINILPTSAGKTIITAALSHSTEKYGRSVVIVPNKDLVIQTEQDYINFGLDVGVYFGDRKELNKTHTICTWQSLEVLNKNQKSKNGKLEIDAFIDGTVTVIVDEVHRTSGAVLRDLLAGPFKNVPIRWGLTGTMPAQEHEKVSVVSAIGPVFGRITAKDLQEKGIIANLDIHVLQFQDTKRSMPFSSYAAELKWLTSNEDRLQLIAKVIESKTENVGNSLVLVDRIEAGERLKELIPNSVFVYGNTKSKARKEEYESINDMDGKVLIATYAVASTGISINRLYNVFLFEPGKSFVRVIQSIGRGLRMAKDKDRVEIYDVCSDCKYSKRHLTERKKFYKEAEYPFNINKVVY